MKKVSVFCASSSQVPGIYFRETELLAHILARENITIQYGGGDTGLMGSLAEIVQEEKGKIIGIIPEFMVKAGWAHKGLDDLVVVKDMHERKRKLIQETGGIIALPGGSGTLEELSEAITSKQLGLISVPIIVVNINGYYNSLLDFFSRMIRENFLRSEHLEMWSIIPDVSGIVKALKEAPGWSHSAIDLARI